MSDSSSRPFDPGTKQVAPSAHVQTGEHQGGKVYLHDPKTVFAVQVAQKTGRPLLLQGPAGSGKSSLATFAANILECRYYSFTVTARTQARDLMWDFDALGRLNDANVAGIPKAGKQVRAKVFNLHNYVTPRPLWWALDRDSARRRGEKPPVPEGEADGEQADGTDEDGLVDPATVDEAGKALPIKNHHDVVLLIDEIDKADPDVPNNLLEVLGSRQFTVAETGTQISANEAQHPLIFITTNNERELPAAFLRRCIVLHLDHKKPTELRDIALKHYGTEHSDLYLPIAEKVKALREEAEEKGLRLPSTAEYLDAVRACIDLQIGPDSEDEVKKQRWKDLVEVSLRKTPEEKKKRNA